MCISSSTNGKRCMTGYTCETTEPPEEIRDLAEEELSGWKFDQHCCFIENEKYHTKEYSISYAMAIDTKMSIRIGRFRDRMGRSGMENMPGGRTKW